MLEGTDGLRRPSPSPASTRDEGPHQRPPGAAACGPRLLPSRSADVPAHLMTSSHSSGRRQHGRHGFRRSKRTDLGYLGCWTVRQGVVVCRDRGQQQCRYHCTRQHGCQRVCWWWARRPGCNGGHACSDAVRPHFPCVAAVLCHCCKRRAAPPLLRRGHHLVLLEA